jgi:hypothetical protein
MLKLIRAINWNVAFERILVPLVVFFVIIKYLF